MRTQGGGSDGSAGNESGGGSVFDPESSSLTRSWSHEDEDQDHDTSSNAVVATLKFVYRYSTSLVPVGVLWTFLSLPLLTFGPASVGLYATVLSLRETGRVDRQHVVETVRANLVPSILLGLAPMTFAGIGALYVLSGLSDGIAGMALTAGALYAGLYLGVLLIPTFVMMARGTEPKTALREAYLWIAGEPTTGLQLLLVTLVLFVTTLGLTIGFALLFAGLAGTYHTEIVCRALLDEDSELGDTDVAEIAGG